MEGKGGDAPEEQVDYEISAVPARLGLRWLWLPQTPGQAKAIKHGLALAWPGLGQGFLVYV